MNTKKTLISLILILILLASTIFFTQKTQAKETPNLRSFTKAICDKNNFCQDYLFECENSKTKSITPITGAFVQYDNNWQDPRTQEQINKECR